ncbi:MAG: rRNA maturation RNase YbeY [Roseobacter sp.]
MPIETVVESGDWSEALLGDWVESASTATLQYVGIDPANCTMTVMGCDDARIALLNADFRDKSTATNVLSWPAEELRPDIEGGMPVAPSPDFAGQMELGDIAIASETCSREAFELEKTVRDHTTHLIVHGTLHLLGYDHVLDLDALLMQGLETEILGKLGLDDPYR